MDKQSAVAGLGETALLQPARVRQALKANDRLKVYLGLLQAAAAHARAPDQAPQDLSPEIAAADIQPRDEAAWLRELPAQASRRGDMLQLPQWPRLAGHLDDDLHALSCPVLADLDADPEVGQRVERWSRVLRACASDELPLEQVSQLCHGQRPRGDSLHLLVMDLHKGLNRLAARLAPENIDGAHVWQLGSDPADRARVAAFMRGVRRTRALKLDHPGLETAATRDGDRLLIQNDIGTNDAHVLVIQVCQARLALTYSDLHRQRYAFMQAMLQELGATWTGNDDRVSQELNGGRPYQVGVATYDAPDDTALEAMLEGIGARIVFLIDWNRARKRLLPFVDRDRAVQVLREAARREVGHMAWLRAGGERLVWGAMAAQGEGVFRLGDRLDDLLGGDEAAALLVDLLALASQAHARGQPVALVADEARLLVARRVMGRRSEFELLDEHAALCHALAQALRDALVHGLERDPAAAEALAVRAKGHHHGWGGAVRTALQALADAVLTATQDHVKALAVAGTLGDASSAADHEDYLDASWRVLQAERRCDELLRSARRALAREVKDAASLALGNDLAAAMEEASDGLLALGHGLREHALKRAVPWGRP
ncbi:MAG: phosphate transport regulator [Aquabacterium sp.]|nr:phosphate transport regulator [Aquabacterium sp.]